jgi:hypothetical protein
MIDRLEWDFSSCPVSELVVCYFYEYTRQAALESEAFVKFAKQPQANCVRMPIHLKTEELLSGLKDLSAYRLLKHFEMNAALASSHTKDSLGRSLFARPLEWQKAYNRARKRVQTLIGSGNNPQN